MPFAVFRRHQRKLLAITGILAMFGFVLADSLPSLLNGGRGGGDPVVAELYGRRVRQSDLAELGRQRQRANAFLSRLEPRLGPQPLGGTSLRELVDAYILQHEADELGIPATPKFGNDWLNSVFGNSLRAETFERVLRESFENLTGEQLLADVANQVRLMQVRNLPGRATVTPLDVFQAYRDQTERVSAQAAPFYVADFVDKVEAPGDAELQAFYDQYKEVEPDPERETPGFKVPRRVQVEYVWADADALARQIKETLTEAELREAFRSRPKEFIVPEPELPTAIFGREYPELTPPLTDPFQEVRPVVERTVADERAREQVDEKFNTLREEALDPFSDKYLEAVEQNQEAKAESPLPAPGDAMKDEAKKLGLNYEKSPLLTREAAEADASIGKAKVGSSQFSDNRTFAQVFFDSKTPIYDPIELIDDLGRRYLAWKLQDVAARVPTLDEIRAEVVRAWKLEKARKYAEEAARELADKARKAGGDLKAADSTRTILKIDPTSRMTPSIVLGPTQFFPSRVNEIPQIPNAGDALRDALFNLEPKQVAVAPNQPKTVYYVLALENRTPAEFDRLYDQFGPRLSVQSEVLSEAEQRRREDWMAYLRGKAKLPADWVPADEARTEASQG